MREQILYVCGVPKYSDRVAAQVQLPRDLADAQKNGGRPGRGHGGNVGECASSASAGVCVIQQAVGSVRVGVGWLSSMGGAVVARRGMVSNAMTKVIAMSSAEASKPVEKPVASP